MPSDMQTDEHVKSRQLYVSNKIMEVREKIHLRERCRKVFDDQTAATEKENDQIIQGKRSENQGLRSLLKKSLFNEQDAVIKLFMRRPKEETLALKRLTVQDVKIKLDHTVCNLERSLNKLISTRNKTIAKFTKMTAQPKKKRMILSNKDTRKCRQIENSLEKVNIKTVTAHNIQKVYGKLKTNLENELRLYPKKLDALEQEKMELSHELTNMKLLNANALIEGDVALKQKSNFENEVRRSRKERETTLKKLRKMVRDIERLIEEQHLQSHNLSLQRKVIRTDSKEVIRLAEFARKTQERLGKIADYHDQANMLENVTGIPFSSFQENLHCLESQKNSAVFLKTSIATRSKKLHFLQTKKGNLKNELDDILYSHEKKIEAKIYKATRNLQTMENKLNHLKQTKNAKKGLADDMITCCEALLSHLIRATINLHLAIPLTNEEKEGSSNGIEIFSMCMDVVKEIYDQAEKQSAVIKDHDVFEIIAPDAELSSILNINNNRIPGQLEKRISEEFDSYDGSKNEQYVSREMIKLGLHGHSPTTRTGRK